MRTCTHTLTILFLFCSDLKQFLFLWKIVYTAKKKKPSDTFFFEKKVVQCTTPVFIVLVYAQFIFNEIIFMAPVLRISIRLYIILSISQDMMICEHLDKILYVYQTIEDMHSGSADCTE